MKNISLTFIVSLLLLSVLCNSCKKETQSSIQTLFTRGTWELATVTVIVSVGSVEEFKDTLNTDCDKKQLFTFSADGTCTYTNFQCENQSATGKWSLSPDQLYLKSDMVCKDTSKVGTGKITPFANAQINTIGQYGMVLITGDIQNYSPTQRRTVYRYGFVRQKTPTQ